MGTEVAKAALPRWGRTQIELLKRTVAKGLTDDEMQLFVYVSRRTGLDPFLRQIYAIKRWDSDLGDYRMTIQTGIDGYRLQASRGAGYAGSDPPEFELDAENRPVRASVTVYRVVGGERCAFTGEARWEEYAQRKKDGGLFSMWEKMPYNQLAKCAEAQALRKAFPAEVQGLMIHEEMPPLDIVATAGEGTAAFVPATLYEGRVTLFTPPDPKKKRPGQIAVAVEGQGVLGPLGFWETPEPLKDREAVGVHVQISYAETTGKKGGTYKNVAHLAVKALEAGAEAEPREEGEEAPPRQPALPASPESPQPSEETPVQYWKRNILGAKSLADLKALWDNFARKGGRYSDFTAQEQADLMATKEKKKAELGVGE